MARNVIVGANASLEDTFAYVASEVFSIVSPYVFHTHASRVFSEISETLRRAQEASAEVVARLDASEMAQAQERHLRAAEARLYVTKLKELQALMKARVEREEEGAKARKTLKRKLDEETSRSAQLEKRLADAEVQLQRLRQDLASEKNAQKALEKWWRSTLDQAVLTAKQAERSRARSKVDAVAVKRLHSLSTEVEALKGKVDLLQDENTMYSEALRARPQTAFGTPKAHVEGQKRASPLCRKGETDVSSRPPSTAAGPAVEKTDTSSSVDFSGGPGRISGDSKRGFDLSDRIVQFISERASGLGVTPRSPPSRRHFISDDDDEEGDDARDVGLDSEFSWFPRRRSSPTSRQQQDQPPPANAGRDGAAPISEGGTSVGTAAAAAAAAAPSSDSRNRSNHENAASFRVGAAAVAEVAAAADARAPSLGDKDTGASSGGSRRRGLGSYGGPSQVGDGAGAFGAAAHEGGDVVGGAKSGTATLSRSWGWRGQRSLGGGDGGSNAPSLRALLASGEFYSARGGEISTSDREKLLAPVPVSTAVDGLAGDRTTRRRGGTRDARTKQGEREGVRRASGSTDESTATAAPAAAATLSPGPSQPLSQTVPRAPSSFRWSADRCTAETRVDSGSPSRFAQGVGQRRAVGEVEDKGVDELGLKKQEEGEVREASAHEGTDEGGRADRVGSSACTGVVTVAVFAGGYARDGGGKAHGDVASEEPPHPADHADENGLHHRHRHPRVGTTATDISESGLGGEEGGVGRAVGRAGGDPDQRRQLSLEPTARSISAPKSSLMTWTFSNKPGTAQRLPRDREKRLDDLFPATDVTVRDIAAADAAAAVVGEDRGKQRLALDELLRDMAVISPESPGEGDNAGGSVVVDVGGGGGGGGGTTVGTHLLSDLGGAEELSAA